MKKIISKAFFRIKRFLFSLSPKIIDSDLEIVNLFLDKNHKKVFFCMSIVDQKHCINVARTLLKSDKELTLNTLRLALLHDIGKQVRNFSVIERSFVVILPINNLKLYSFPIKNNFPIKSLQIKKFHHEYGEKIANYYNFDSEITELIKNHHSTSNKKEIINFQWSDNLN